MSVNDDQLKKFKKLARSLSLYGRHTIESVEVENFQALEQIYIDPLPGNGSVDTILNKRFSLVLGRKGTGKSILFNVCQEKLTDLTDSVGVYVNCHEIYQEESYDLVTRLEKYRSGLNEVVGQDELTRYLLRRQFIEKMLSELVSSIEKKINGSLKERFLSKIGQGKLNKVLEKLESIKSKLSNPEDIEIQLLKQKHLEKKTAQKSSKSKSLDAGGKAGVSGSADITTQKADGSVDGQINYTRSSEEHQGTLNYQDYSTIFVSIFKPREIIREIFSTLNDAGIKKVFIFADDYSELSLEYQGIFSNSILSQYHQMTDHNVFLSLAGYPSRCFLGNTIDKSKVTPLEIDFDVLYKDKSLPEKHSLGIEFAKKVLEKRLSVFCPAYDFWDFFNKSSSSDKQEFYKVLFQASYNCPRIIGAVLEKCVQTELANGRKIGLPAIRAASRSFYDGRVSSYLRVSKFSIRESDVPFYSPIDVFNQLELLEHIAEALKDAQTKIHATETYRSHYGKQPPVSHFHVSAKYAEMLKFLVNNYFINPVSEQQVKAQKLTATIYALNLGLCEKKNMKYWEPDPDRRYRNYLIERAFYLDEILENFLDQQKEILCSNCGIRYSISEKDSIESFHWTCRECGKKACKVHDVNYEKTSALVAVPEESKLPSVEIEILEALDEHQSDDDPIYPKTIAGYIDQSYQLVTKRMIKLAEDDYRLVDIRESDPAGTKIRRVYQLSEKARGTYF